MLAQKRKGSDQDIHINPTIIAYASRALSNVEQRYSQTEKEALAILWFIEHFHMFLYGNDFTLITDHRSLKVIYNRKMSKL